MYTIMAIYPPGEAYQRGEERCQIPIEFSVANSIRACNDLGYICSVLKGKYNCVLRDYQGEELSIDDLTNDIKINNPDVVFISTTNGTIYKDIEVIKKIKNVKKDTAIIIKGALFFNPDKSLFENLDLSDIDYLIGGEVEFLIDKLLNAHFFDKNLLTEIEGISYKKDNVWHTNKMTNFQDNFDDLPFPDRDLMKNELYINPETSKPMALITTSKGCCFSCKYCLSPVISGRKVRHRSAESIFAEIKDCVQNHNITEFFLKSDTFTTDKSNVLKLCELIKNEHYDKKINWVATSRVDTIDEEMVKNMKESGCSLLAIGFESGNNDTLSKIGKNTTVEQNLKAAKLCKKYKIKILGYFLIGFPWEGEKEIKQTEKHILDIDADYVEVSVVVPYIGTPIYSDMLKGSKNIDLRDVLGKDSYKNVYENFSNISTESLQKYRNRMLLKFYLRPKYIFNKLCSVKNASALKNYVKYGLKMLKNIFVE